MTIHIPEEVLKTGSMDRGAPFHCSRHRWRRTHPAGTWAGIALPVGTCVANSRHQYTPDLGVHPDNRAWAPRKTHCGEVH
jgi:hypothetical protein